MESLPKSAEFVSSSRMRLRLLLHLITGPKSPSELASMEKKHASHVSRALTEMRMRGLVECSRSDSRERYYTITTQGYAVYAIVSRIIK